jgi:hypothetical protein
LVRKSLKISHHIHDFLNIEIQSFSSVEDSFSLFSLQINYILIVKETANNHINEMKNNIKIIK